MLQKVWVKKSCSFFEAQDYDLEYYLNLSPGERLETIQFLCEKYFKRKRNNSDEGGKGLRRAVRFIGKES